jgi:predicted dehydrogenase
MNRFSWGLLGPGRIAHKFAEAVQRTPGMHLARVHGRDAARAEAFARRWAVDGRPVPLAGTDLAALLADPAIDAVYVATPHAQHAQAIEAALHAGKPVLCEKPLVATAVQAERVAALARERGVFLMEALWTRFLPVYAAMRTWFGDGGLGAVCAVQASFAYPTRFDPADRQWDPAAAGGALLDLGIYPLALTRWALEPAPGACPAVTRSVVTGTLAPSGVDQRVHATLWFEGGAVAQFVSARPHGRQLAAHPG